MGFVGCQLRPGQRALWLRGAEFDSLRCLAVTALDDELLTWYKECLSEQKDLLAAALQALSADPERSRETIRKTAHSLHGSGATYGFPEISELAARVEFAEDTTLTDETNHLVGLLANIIATA